ncbi:unnamed protein product [Adineta ricciae]|uniref:Uncharacterized protein n=1 Tax=Adineta ricciae TaxID=249248 RepID=A0A816A9T5_ADIRI|nr:unnamed protein product [Adineta ricciae]
MKIKYDVPHAHEEYAIVFSLVHIWSIVLFYAVPLHLFNAHQLVARSRLTNQTDFNAEVPICTIPFDELCCSVLQSTDPKILKHCVPDSLLMLSRISVPVSMIMIVFILQFAFTIDGKHSRLIVRTLWAIYAFVLVIITYGVHYNSCFYTYTFVYMIIPSGALSSTIMVWTLERRDRRFRSHRNDNNSNHATIEVDDGPIEAVDDTPIVWTKIL